MKIIDLDPDSLTPAELAVAAAFRTDQAALKLLLFPTDQVKVGGAKMV